MKRSILHFYGLAVLVSVMVLAGCAPSSESVANAAENIATTAAITLPSMLVHKDESCGCCVGWIEHVEQAGFKVEAKNQPDMSAIKRQLAVPYGKESCHTAEVAGYFIEGHVPVEDVLRLLAEKPDAKGLVVAGMPIGSPGMEVPDGTVHPYTVELVKNDGTTEVFAQH